jgi:hypothetical protein
VHGVLTGGDLVNERQNFALGALLVIALATLMSVALLVIGLSEKGVCVG